MVAESQPETNENHDQSSTEGHSTKTHTRKRRSSTSDSSTNKRKLDTPDEIVIDHSMGASFADALRILDQKKPKILHKLSKRLPVQSLTKPSQIPLDQPSSSKSSSIQVPVSSFNSEPNAQISVKESLNSNQLAEAQAMSSCFKSKTERTKVFSGFKLTLCDKVPKLYDLCLRWLMEHIDDLEFIGGIPYYILKPVLERASVQQLLTIEDFNPYLIEDTDELWEMHCKRHFRGRQPDELESWRELYLRAEDERQVKFALLTKNIKTAHEQPGLIKKTKLAIIETRMNHKKNRVHKIEPPKPNTRNYLLVKGTKNYNPVASTPGPQRQKITPLLVRRSKSTKSFHEDDPEWLPGNQYTRNDQPKKSPEVRKTIDMIRYDRAKREADHKQRKKLKKVVDKDHPYSAPSTVPASPTKVARDHNYL